MPAKPFKRLLVVLSGGQDSTTCLFWAKTKAEEVLALTFDYGQRHAVEIQAATHVAALADAQQHEIITLGAGVLQGTSPLVNPGKEVETYVSAEALPGGIEKTFVPMRNALFIVLAMNRAVVHRCDGIVLGVSEEDYGGYPDCRERFLDAIELATHEALAESVIGDSPLLLSPLLHMDKRETVDLSESIQGCREALAYSHTCYNGASPPCGVCHACLLREKGYAQAHVTDPLIERLAGRG